MPWSFASSDHRQLCNWLHGSRAIYCRIVSAKSLSEWTLIYWQSGPYEITSSSSDLQTIVRKIHPKMYSAKWDPFCLSMSVLKKIREWVLALNWHRSHTLYSAGWFFRSSVSHLNGIIRVVVRTSTMSWTCSAAVWCTVYRCGNTPHINIVMYEPKWPLLPTWINFNPSMDK